MPYNPNVSPAVYLLEERIPGVFEKYISNGTPLPRANLDDEDRNIAEYLSFAQHFQYVLTNRSMFVSDFQGA